MKTTVVNKRNNPYDVYIGRGSKWGNPFSYSYGTMARFKVDTRQEAIEAYRQWILTQRELLNSLQELKGKVLGCFFKPLDCHGDVLIELIEKQLIKREKVNEYI